MVSTFFLCCCPLLSGPFQKEPHADARFLLAERRDWLLLAVSHGPTSAILVLLST